MSGAPSLPPPPTGMEVHVDHDGVDWQDRYGAVGRGTLMGAVMAVVGVLMVLTLMLALPLWAPAGLFLMGVLAVAALARQGRGQLVVLRPDRIWIGEPPDRTEILFDDLLDVQVSLPDSRQPCLVLKARDGSYPVGLGAPEAHLRWFAAAIAQARHHDARTDKAAGHELFFHRQQPEAFQRGPSDERPDRDADRDARAERERKLRASRVRE